MNAHSFWIGFNDKALGGSFTWAGGSNTTYGTDYGTDPWESGNPSNVSFIQIILLDQTFVRLASKAGSILTFGKSVETLELTLLFILSYPFSRSSSNVLYLEKSNARFLFFNCLSVFSTVSKSVIMSMIVSIFSLAISFKSSSINE